MNKPIRHLYAIVCISLALGQAAASRAEDTAESAQAKAKLAAVRGQIAALTDRLGGELKDRNRLAARLREAELSITEKCRRLDSLHAEQTAGERRREVLRSEEARDQRALDAQQAALAAQARAAYMLGQQEQIKLLLNQSDPARAGRMLAYYGYLAHERTTKINQFRDQLAKVREVVTEIDQTTAELQALQIDTNQEVSDLQQARVERTAALAAVMKEMSSGSEQLAILKRQEQAEESLVADLARVLQDFPVDSQQSFQALRGRLPWPVQGQISARYQQQRSGEAGSGTRWNGVLIETTHGAKVRAPYYGRVVYADWLQGLGLLLIIGHSGGYMTLYGHAEVLYKSVGDWVAPGDVIASLSDAAGAAPQLYFEIREGRKTVDPKTWLKAVP